MRGTQGIYTDNMYIGDGNQYVAFYEDDNGDRHLKISGKEFIFEYDPNTGEEITWEDKINEASQGADGEDAISVIIDSSAGNIFTNPNEITHLKCYVYKGSQDITNTVTSFTWTMKDKDGNIVSSWQPMAGREVDVSAAQILSKGVITCEVEF